MTNTLLGTVTIVQEGRFQVIDDSGIAHMFILAPGAAAETDQLKTLQRQQSRVCVHFTAASNVIGNRVSAIYVEV